MEMVRSLYNHIFQTLAGSHPVNILMLALTILFSYWVGATREDQDFSWEMKTDCEGANKWRLSVKHIPLN